MTSAFAWGAAASYLISTIQTVVRDIWKAKREAKARIEAAKLARAKRME